MVICCEVPLYVTEPSEVGGGAYSIEDELLITANGYEKLTNIESDLVEV